MKILVLLCFLFYTLTPAHSQVKYNKTKVPKLPRTGSNIVYTASVALDPSYSKELLFNNGVQWYKRNFESADNRLSINDADAGRLSGAVSYMRANMKRKFNHRISSLRRQ